MGDLRLLGVGHLEDGGLEMQLEYCKGEWDEQEEEKNGRS